LKDEELTKFKEGEPIPLSKLQISRRKEPSNEILIALCKSIPIGYAQQIRNIPGSTLRDRIRRLKQAGLLPNEYRVSIKGKEKKVYIVHEEVKPKEKSRS
jgi:hypothetical protein